MIPARDLSLLANRLAARGGRRLPEAVLERDYCIAWFLVALSRTPLRERLAFKGGTALKRFYFADYRFSEDLDFTLAIDSTLDEIRRGLEPVFAEARAATGALFRFAREDRHAHENSLTFYVAYEGPLPAPAGGREVKVDVTVRERLVLPLVDRPVLRGYAEYADLPEGATVRTYSLGEIAAEKVVALTDRARNEPRDLYDTWYLVSEAGVALADLVEAVELKWGFRGRTLRDVQEEFAAKEPRYRRLWTHRLASQMVALPEFDTVYRTVRRALRRAGLQASA